MASRNEFDDFFGDDDEAPAVDTRADGRLYRVPVARIAPNLVNPRTDFGTEADLIDFGKSLTRRQNQPCPVVSRNAYLKLWPEHADRIKDVDYVLVSGERRYRAAKVVGLGGLDCVANDAFANSRKDFLEAVVSENVDRQNFDPIEEAYAVQSLVEAFGGNRQVAQHFERSDGWVTQRVCLTYLSSALQERVRKKELSLELARSTGQKAKANGWDAAQQMQWLTEERERIAREREAKREAKKAGTQPSTPVAQENPETGGGAGESFTAVKLSASSTPTAEAEGAAEAVTAVNGSPAAGERTPPKSGPTEAATPELATEAADRAEAVTTVNGTTAEPPVTAMETTAAGTGVKPAAVPDPRAHEQQASATGVQGDAAERPKLDYSNGPWIARHLGAKMDPGPYFAGTQLMLRQSWEKGETEALALLAGFMEQALERSPKEFQKLLEASSERLSQAH